MVPLAISESDHVTFTTSPQYYDAQLRLDWSPTDHDDLAMIAFTGWDFAAAGIATENALDPDASGGFTNQIGFTRAALLDLRIDREWIFDGWRLSAYLDVSNVYNHLRATSYNYDFNYGQREAVTTFPIFPALGVRGGF